MAREEAAEYLRAYAESALTSAAFIKHTDYTVEEALPLVRPHPIAMSLQTAIPPLTRPFSPIGVRTPLEETLSRPHTSSPIRTGTATVSPMALARGQADALNLTRPPMQGSPSTSRASPPLDITPLR